MTSKIAPKTTTRKTKAASRPSIAALQEALLAFRETLANTESKLRNFEAMYSNLEHEVVNTERSLLGVAVLLAKKDGGEILYVEEAKVILDLTLDNLTQRREHFASFQRDVAE